MMKNVGCVDRVVRLCVGIALVVWAVTSGNWIGYIGIIPILTGLTGFCPAYCPLKINTCGGSCGCGEGKGSCSTK